MINTDKLTSILNNYKTAFSTHWLDEKYKWEAVQFFQDHWDIDAEDFSEMFKLATSKTYNLLASGYSYPRAMILNFAKADDEGTRTMFRKLFDETVDLVVRIDGFISSAEEMRTKHDDGTWKNHFQSLNAISTYLWLMYPDKYYIYKYTEARTIAKELSSDFNPSKGGPVETILGCYKMYDEICEVIKADSSISKMLQNSLAPECYPDTELKTLTTDVTFYFAVYYPQEKKAELETDEWYPNDYNPGITVEKWIDLLNDKSVFTDSSLQIMKRFQDIGGQATCLQLSQKYGEGFNFYNGGSWALARRIAKKVNCPVMVKDNENSKWWPILYLGKKADKTIEGAYIWKLRDELAEALELVDLSDVELYAKPEQAAEETESSMLEKYTKEDFLKSVFMTEGRYEVLKALLLNKKNVILQGAPGVGKTFAAERLAYSIIGEKDKDRVTKVQFHQNYSYEDFVMGYRPDGEGFKLTEGIFYRFCRKAAEDPDRQYFFIIDEINRGNLSKIFGELLMLIEKDYRGTEISLAYNGEVFTVPENLYIIGMMNTADRSLAMIDYALRRRFSFFAMEPGFDSEGFMNYLNSFDNETFKELVSVVKSLNKFIHDDKSLGAGFEIGHSYFCGREELGVTDDWLRSVVDFDILPTLSEYWFDNKASYDVWDKNLHAVFHD